MWQNRKTSIHTYNSAEAQINSDNFTTTPTTLLEQQLNMLVGSLSNYYATCTINTWQDLD